MLSRNLDARSVLCSCAEVNFILLNDRFSSLNPAYFFAGSIVDARIEEDQFQGQAAAEKYSNQKASNRHSFKVFTLIRVPIPLKICFPLNLMLFMQF
jgi:hypothetical protein